MEKLSPQTILDTLKPGADSRLVLALSGGLDSMVLLHLLARARQHVPFELTAVYINHGLSQHAEAWAAFCAEQCQQLQVSFIAHSVQIDGSDNLEHKARAARYQALAQFIVTDKHQLLTAHHNDDQLETLLLALKRGAGAAGLSGIAAKRPFAAGILCRPLLSFSRDQLAHYASEQQLQWVEDDSNDDSRFERNFIRQQLTPLLKARWPHFADSAARSMAHIAQLQQLAEHYSEQALAQCVNQQGLSLSALAAVMPLQQDLVLRKWLAAYGLNPETQWLATLKQQVIQARHDAMPQLQLAGYQVRRYADTLYLLSVTDVTMSAQPILWQGESELKLAANCGCLYFSLQPGPNKLALSATSGSWVFGELSRRFKPAGAANSKPLKQWFKLWQVPPWQRQRIPLLVVDDELVAVAGYASNTLPEQARLWLHWQQ
uniref:tRNA(Ile)-lysidine synthase n=1 Tax=Rheinheimera sp. BAL341 TaxID=1708203 RepID=A0A486XJ47_9GAMM